MDKWNARANEIFLDATEIHDPGDRAKYVESACGGDSQLQRQVDSLLSADRKAGGFMARSASETQSASVSNVGPGTVIGRYKLLQQIGEGGFGVVYMSEQDDSLQRKVALKLIKPGMDSKQVIARFETERQALALMEHPNIARVLDADTTVSGLPYFVMELVKGIPITDFCDKHKLTLRERLQLFVPVCNAIQHAHQKGIIHRDIKPSNILVSQYDGEPVPKVIDFGVAKAVQQRLTEKTMFTQFGQVIGTLEYMSPEQAEFNQLDVDTRADIYALGAVLYELLAGTPPLEAPSLRTAAFDEMLRIIREEEPPRPSLRLSTTAKLVSISTQRSADPAKLSKSIHGDLDWIVMKAIEKNRNRRYTTPSDLAADIDRYLQGSAIEARPPSVAYRLQKFVTRHRVMVAAASAVLLTLIASLVGTTLAWRSAAVARDKEETARLNETAERQKAESARDLAEKERDRADAESARANKAVIALRRKSYSSLIAAADAARREGKLNSARQLLRQCPEELRHWEWRYLDVRSRRTNLCTIPAVNNISFAPDGKHIVGIVEQDDVAGQLAQRDTDTLKEQSFTGEIAEWDAETGEKTRTIAKIDRALWSGELSPKGDKYIVSDLAYRLMMIDVESGALLWSLDPDQSRYNSMRFSDDGRTVAVCNHETKVLSSETGERIATISEDAHGFGFSGDGELLATHSSIYRVSDGERITTLDSGASAGRAVDLSPDKKWVAVGGLDGAISLFDAESGSRIRRLEGHSAMLLNVLFSPDGKRLFSASADTTIRVWDVASGEPVQLLGDHDDQIYWLASNSDASLVASYGLANGVMVWAADQTPSILTMFGTSGVYGGATFNAAGTEIVAKDANSIIHIWDAQTGAELRKFSGHPDDSDRIGGGVLLHPTRPWFATGGARGQTDLVNIQTGEVVRTFGKHRGGVYHVAFSPDGKRLVTAGSDARIVVWDIESGQRIYELEGSRDGLNQIGYSSDGKWIAASVHQEVNIWHAEHGRLHRAIDTPVVDSIAFSHVVSPDAVMPVRLACGCRNGQILVFDPETGRRLGDLKGRASWIVSLRFSRDGHRLWTCGVDLNLTVWNLDTAEELLAIREHDQFLGFNISPDDRAVVTASADGTVKLWESEPPDLQLAAERRRVDQARRSVDRLFSDGLSKPEVVHAILSDDSLSDPIRELQLRTARVRLDSPDRGSESSD